MEIVETLWEGSPVRIVMSHADAVAKLSADGYLPPRIPEGCNTVSWYYQDRDNHQALVVNQRGFAREIGCNAGSLSRIRSNIGKNLRLRQPRTDLP